MSGLRRGGEDLDRTDVVRDARDTVGRRARELGREDLADDASLVVSELVTNAMLHGRGCTAIEISSIEGGLRVEVRDRSQVPPMLGQPSDESLTGRGLRLVERLSARWGAKVEADGKVVWAEITGEPKDRVDHDAHDLLAMWDDEWDLAGDGERRFHLELGNVPTDLLLAAKSHVDNLVRELTLASSGASSGVTAEIPAHLASLVSAVVDHFGEARVAIKRQALEAARRGEETTRLALELPVTAADAAEDYLRALDELDAYCRARRLLTLASPPQHQVFRHWYIDELVNQLRAAVGRPARAPQSFKRRLLAEFDRVADARRAAEHAARLYSVAAALARAATPENVAEAVLTEGTAALGAAGGRVLLATDAERLMVSGAVGYDEALVARLRNESRNAELPAAVALRTGESVWLESRAERDERFPQLAGLEPATVALCAVPLEVQGRRLGALRFSFSTARLFDEEERRFVQALAAQAAQALDRAQLQRSRLDVSSRLQRSLLPPKLPDIPGVEVAAIYHPFGDGMDVGGDFYDVWPVTPGRWALAIGDVAGTGPEAAALSALVRHTLRALAITMPDPEAVMRTLNAALLDVAGGDDDERFFTAIFGLVTTGDRIEVSLTSGGHPPPIVRRADGSTEILHIGGSLLGCFPEPDVQSTRLLLDGGDTLVLVTDGVLEARRDGAPFDVTGLEEVLAAEVGSARATAAAVEHAAVRHTGGSLIDDLVAVVFHVPA